MARPILRTVRNAADLHRGDRQWFTFKALSADETRIDIYDEISWFGITAADFNRELKQVTSRAISLHLNSPGGDVFDGIAIYNALKQHPATVNVTIDAIAASIASVIAMAGDRVEMSQGSMLMIHEPFALVIGDATDMRKQAEALDLMGDSIAGIYAGRAGGKPEEWRAAMREETWYSDSSAVDAKLADAVSGQTAAKNVFDLSIFRNAPRPALPDTITTSTNSTLTTASVGYLSPPQPARDWRHSARLAVASAQLEDKWLR